MEASTSSQRVSAEVVQRSTDEYGSGSSFHACLDGIFYGGGALKQYNGWSHKVFRSPARTSDTSKEDSTNINGQVRELKLL